MALTDGSVNNGYLGPGHFVLVQIPAGPIPNDDYVEALITDGPSGRNLVGGSSVTNGALNVFVQLAVWHTTVRIGAPDAGTPFGGTINLRMNQRHANGVLVDFGNVVGTYLYDPVGGLYVFAASTAVLAAVTRTFQNAP